ncbi:ImmA/IrrE family metallo-endopeptidase [Clostridium felsineum]|uniref:ImmA/IrrE family metallo-endopeptidase n=1 Tax=Clostridium felsineum TaxID=36839 RepID=UPI00214D6568|nr:ImmA/IrrE family metallo-endopeptidase [Clostridium felsineum]MCR3758879.1 ImmA/IrrE family metallo-endopeptidase [Clostridium felsineum]
MILTKKRIDEVILGLLDTYNTNDPYELCAYLNIKLIKVDSTNPLLLGEPALYIKNLHGNEVIFINNDLNYSYNKFYLSHELGHALLHPFIRNSFNSNLINIDKMEHQANYFAIKLMKIKFNSIELHQMTLEQIASCLELPNGVLKQLVKI